MRTAAAAGCRAAVLTNAAGSLEPAWPVGQAVLLADHLNLTGRSPLVGARFVDLTDAYSPRLRALAREVDPTLPEGVYAAMPGPHYETPAEIRMLRTLGADLVGMSTVHETIAARAEGMEVLALSLVTNAAGGLPASRSTTPRCWPPGRAAADRMGTLLADVHGPAVSPNLRALAAQARVWMKADCSAEDAREVERVLRCRRGRRRRRARRPRRPVRRPAARSAPPGCAGPLRAGPNGMNRAVVRRAAYGLCHYLDARGAVGPVVIGYDARHGSAAFAADTARVVTAHGPRGRCCCPGRCRRRCSPSRCATSARRPG